MDTNENSPITALVIGAGVAGCLAARELARFDLRTVVLESGNDVACGATRANSAIVHAGYDPVPGTLKARFNVAGSKAFPQLAHELLFGFKNNGSLVVAYTEEELDVVKRLVEQGKANGVDGVRLIGREDLVHAEPNVNNAALGALLASTGGICNPYYVAFAAAENAAENGVEFRFNARVERVERTEGGWRAVLADGSALEAACVVNAAGVYADVLNNQASSHKLRITPRRGEYCLFDTGYGDVFEHTMFQAPTPAGKGVLVTPTTHGNLLIGPNAVAQDSRDDVSTTAEGLADVVERAKRTWPALDTRGIITNFCGVRATGDTHDFVVGQPDDAPGFFNIACFDSPGLTSAPAVGAHVARLVAEYADARPNAGFEPRRAHAYTPFSHMDDEQRASATEHDPRQGRMVCRCCTVTEADVLRAFDSPLPVLDVDALKWRTGAMMGRCHGGFCTPEVVRLLAHESGVVPDEMDKRLPGSNMVAASRPDYLGLVAEQFKAEEAEDERILAAHSAHEPEEGMPDEAPYDVTVVGGGAAGVAAATKACGAGAKRVLLLDREGRLGGILKQCVHNGFGLHRFRTELTGPEYATREVEALAASGTQVVGRSSVLRIDPAPRPGAPGEAGLHTVVAVCPEGDFHVRTRTVVLATGSRERGAGALNMAGSRPSGVFSAGSAQNLMNLQGCLPGKDVVVLGSGDIGLIMARRMVSQGAHVVGVYEIMPHPSGLRRNIVQCLQDYGIPLHLSTTVVRLEGATRLEAVWVQKVDKRTLSPIEGTAVRVPCDTLLLSVGLLPENEVAKTAGVRLDPVTGGAIVDEQYESSLPGVYACGNALHIHDLVDHASDEGDKAGKAAAKRAASMVRAERKKGAADADVEARRLVPIEAGEGVRYVVPQRVDPARLYARNARMSLSFRVRSDMRDPRFSLVAYDSKGEEREVTRSRALIAVPAEMVEMRVRPHKLDDVVRFKLVARPADAIADEEGKEDA